MIEMSSPPFRSGTVVNKTKVALVFNAGGIGDYIHWVGAMKYAIDSSPHIEGYILAPEYFYDLADLWLGKYSNRFTVVPYKTTEDIMKFDVQAVILPDNKQLANACGFHLTDLGFIYYTQKNKTIPQYERIPRILGNEIDIKRFALPSEYAVITIEATADNRRLPAETINKLTEHLISRGVTPVFLGRSALGRDHISRAEGGINLWRVRDLRETTSLREAACIMAGAKFVLGIDGGLLHLACCSDVPVAFIFTTVHPQYRVPRGRSARTVVVVPPADLGCRFCNSGDPGGPDMLYVLGHDFKHCLYKDNLCTKLITAETLIPVMDDLLGDKNENGTRYPHDLPG